MRSSKPWGVRRSSFAANRIRRPCQTLVSLSAREDGGGGGGALRTSARVDIFDASVPPPPDACTLMKTRIESTFAGPEGKTDARFLSRVSKVQTRETNPWHFYATRHETLLRFEMKSLQDSPPLNRPTGETIKRTWHYFRRGERRGRGVGKGRSVMERRAKLGGALFCFPCKKCRPLSREPLTAAASLSEHLPPSPARVSDWIHLRLAALNQ